jgi:hypothetical protein
VGLARGAETPTAGQIIERTITHARDAEIRPNATAYTYTKETVTEEMDAKGKVRERQHRVYEASFRDGTTHLKLLTVNGRPPRQAELKEQQEREKTTRRLAGQTRGGQPSRRDNLLTPELVSRFEFRLTGQSMLDGRPTYLLEFHPKAPTTAPRHMMDRLLNRISGTLWIDVAESEIARADIRLDSEVDLLGGLAGSLKKLAFTFVRTRLEEGVWFNTSSNGDFEGRKLLDSLRIRTCSQCTDFKPLMAGF